MKKVLVTGAAGFIGFHVAKALLSSGREVIGFDNLNDYYDVDLKRARRSMLCEHQGYTDITADLDNRRTVEQVFLEHRPNGVIHLAAQAGVRYASVNPHVYVQSNLVGFLHILEGCRHHGVQHLVYASTSSVYGANRELPFSEHQSTEHPLTLYAATKKSNEMMAHSYSHLYGIPTTGLRFFTVYGPWGRPDMALFMFTKAILSGEPIQIFNYGHHRRSFTYIDDIVEGVVRSLVEVPSPNLGWDSTSPDPATSGVGPYRIYNIGNEDPVELMRYVEVLERCLGRKAIIEYLPLQAGDVPDTEADVSDLTGSLGYSPQVSVEEGVASFVEWYRHYYRV